MNPFDIASLAAQLDPTLARTDPSEAVELARALLSAAGAEEEMHEYLQDQWDRKLEADSQYEEERFPTEDRISLDSAFEFAAKTEKFPFKRQENFVNALRKSDLIIRSWRSPRHPGKYLSSARGRDLTPEETTTRHAVSELLLLRKESRRNQDRKRKAKGPSKKRVKSKN